MALLDDPRPALGPDPAGCPVPLEPAPRTPEWVQPMVFLCLLLPALFLPEAVGRFVREHLIGVPVEGWPGPDLPQKILALLGALLLACPLREHEGRPPGRVRLPDPSLARLVALPFAGYCLFNLSRAAGLLPLVPRQLRMVFALSCLLGFGILCLLWLSRSLLGECLDRGRLPLVLGLGLAAGAGYGCYSALWHCCPPLWSEGPEAAWMAAAALILGSLAIMGFLAALGLRHPFPRGEILGALLLGIFYPYHTPLWQLHCAAGGAFGVWLARRSGSILTPGVAVAAAFLSHMTLPFLGWQGLLWGLCLLFSICFLFDLARHGGTLDPS